MCVYVYIYVYIYTHTQFPIHSSIVEHLGCFLIMVAVNNSTVGTGVPISLWSYIFNVLGVDAQRGGKITRSVKVLILIF